MKHQTHTTTELNRYPDIFEYVSKFKDIYDILSFGCSSGEEYHTLHKYFPNSNIYGVDINKEILETAKNNNLNKSIFFFDSTESIPNVDIIFAMSVFCRWSETDGLEYNHIYSFKDFNEELIKLDDKLNSKGIFVLYNCNYHFLDSDISDKYTPINIVLRDEFVRKFDKTGKYSQNKSPIIFIKK